MTDPEPEPGAAVPPTAGQAAGPEPVTDPQQAPARQPRRDRLRDPRTATVVLALSVVFGTLLLLWGSDWLARIGAQSLLASTVQDETGTTTEPEVTINGSFFLPQVLRGRYDDVQIDLEDVSSGPLRIHTLHARLTGVHLPFHDVLVRSSNQIVIDQAAEQALLTYDDINAYLAFTGRSVTVEPTNTGDVRLTVTAQILGQTITASTDAQISAQDGALALSPTKLNTDTVLDASSELLLGQRFTFQIPMDPLPFGQHITDIHPQDTGLAVLATGSNILITP